MDGELSPGVGVGDSTNFNPQCVVIMTGVHRLVTSLHDPCVSNVTTVSEIKSKQSENVPSADQINTCLER